MIKKIPAATGYIIAIVLIGITFANSVSFNSTRIDSGPKELLELQDWYDKNIPDSEKGKKIAARKPHVAYYLNMKFTLLPMAKTYDELIAELKKNNVDYLYFSTIEAAMRREFQSLLNPQLVHPGLKAVVYFNNPPAVLYRLIYN